MEGNRFVQLGGAIALAAGCYLTFKYLEGDEGARALSVRDGKTEEQGGTEGAVSCPNHALVYLKPHVTSSGDRVGAFVRKFFNQSQITIVSEGFITSEVIENKKLIDKHFAAIAKYAYASPSQLAVSEDKKKEFELAFGRSWESALETVYNAKEAAEFLKISTDDLNERWLKNSENLVKLAPSLYVTYLEEDALFVINGFYGAMREKYVRKDARIQYFVVKFCEKEVPWKVFREEIVGVTDPSAAHESSLRGILYKSWESLGLSFQPNIADNGIHGSAGPLVALREREVWLGTPLQDDPFGKIILSNGVSTDLLKQWLLNPFVQLCVGGEEREGPSFDLTEDMDSDQVIWLLTHTG